MSDESDSEYIKSTETFVLIKSSLETYKSEEPTDEFAERLAIQILNTHAKSEAAVVGKFIKIERMAADMGASLRVMEDNYILFEYKGTMLFHNLEEIQAYLIQLKTYLMDQAKTE